MMRKGVRLSLREVMMAAGLVSAGLMLEGAFAAESGARVVLLKGKAYRRLGQRSVLLREGERVGAGTWIVTAQDGFLKVLLPDRSVLSLGPNSEVQMDAGTKPEAMPGESDSEPPSVNLVRGRLRASVPTSKPEARSAVGSGVGKVKFVVRTRSAVMGVRGTEFQAIYHPANEITSVLTFEGSVAMAQGGRDLGGEGVVLVTEGRFSSATPEFSMPSLPQRISPVQFDALKKEGEASTRGNPPAAGAGAGASTASALPALPPGLDPKLAATENESIDRRFSEGGEREMPRALAAGLPPPEGISDAKTGTFAPPAGGFLDLKTGIYVAPPPGSRFDPNAGVFIPPQSYGTIDSRSGEYVPPAGFKLDPQKGFVPRSDREARGNHPKPMIAPLKASFHPEGQPEEPRPRGEFHFFTPPLFPVDDPLCPECSGRELPLQPPPTAVTQIRFQIGVGP